MYTNVNMKKYIIIGLTLAAAAVTMQAVQSEIADGRVKVLNAEAVRQSEKLNVNMAFVLDSAKVSSNRGLVFTPMIVGEGDTLKMPSVEVLGRKRYIFYERTGKTSTENPQVVTRRNNGQPQTEAYAYTTDYQEWMDDAQIVVAEGECGCSQSPVGQATNSTVGQVPQEPKVYLPDWNYAYVTPTVEEVKTREIEGSARLNFQLAKYDILPNFGRNASELQKIRNTIDVARRDSDVTITRIVLHGYASPDGLYTKNEKLAFNRTHALRGYLTQVYTDLPQNIYTVKSTAEDWDGVYKYVEENADNLPAGFAAIVHNSKLTPDQKDTQLAKKYPSFYLNEIKNGLYPTLRRTDYRIEYNVRQFSLEEAKRIIKERPQNLSLNEMYLVANTYEPGSEEFCDVFDTAVRMFPESEPANVNAACAAMSRDDLQMAERYLQRAGKTAEADNARGVLAARQADLDKAEAYFKSAGNLEAAKSNLKELELIKNNQKELEKYIKN